ncbi:flagellar basal-body rod protein FlgG [Pseudoduganella ginsengisoli]|uniref:Flagellar basal-body rod protein FlgG n=1 Tax=Pseudoduganella ginsengisoli TaxID=1462440 RepID=A0A6L6Q845_9BURK|nr:flagellar basal-body rod protein FlgG [Pseudoduganella ginsengisoli]MTW05957.1 flagellar basal-body rod protein FlgG [Pseudoduganella ginsengisoli]
MNESLYIAATGMQAQQLSIDATANNLANVSTAGFKKGRVNFQEMMHVEPAAAGTGKPAPLGLGISVGGIARDFAPGPLTQTGAAMDLAIDGNGFLEVVLADGSRGYSRGGTLQVSKDGYLADAGGHVLRPAIAMPAGADQLQISADGKVSVRMAGQDSRRLELGQLELAHFANPGALQQVAGGVYVPGEGSGDAVYGKAGVQGLGRFAQGALENSNVTLVDEMVTLMVAQRAYEMGSKVIQASDELMSMTNNLRR